MTTALKPYEQAVYNYNNSIDVWVEITEDYYDHLLNVLPPMLWDGGSFLLCEAWSDNAVGETLYLACTQGRSREGQSSHFCRIMTVKEFKEWRRTKCL